MSVDKTEEKLGQGEEKGEREVAGEEKNRGARELRGDIKEREEIIPWGNDLSFKVVHCVLT